MSEKITEFTILGERCSGTNFLEDSMTTNFTIPLVWKYGWKHWFGFEDFKNKDNVLFIGIIRDPIVWINSFKNKPHHVHNTIAKNKDKFLNDEFWSTAGKNDNPNENPHSKNFTNGERYKNIMEMRSVKLNYLRETMPTKVKNYILIRYEDFCDDYQGTLEKIMEEFNLEKKTEGEDFLNGIKKKGGFYKHQYTDEEILNHASFDIEEEKKMGYCLDK